MANLQKMEKLLAMSVKKGADVVVFPEYSVTGSVRRKPHLIDAKGKYRKIFSFLAKKHRIDIVPGSFIEREKGKAYNTSCYFERSGKMLGIYRKKNLWHSERGRLARGRNISVFNTRFGRAALAICWDLSDPLIFREMARAGARIIYVPSFWSDAGVSNNKTESRNIDALCHARAFETEAAIVYVNAAGKYSENDTLTGCSQLTLPIKGAVARLGHNREGILMARVGTGDLERAAKVYKIRKDIRSGYNK